MSRVPTGSVAPSILAILAASRWASVTPRVRSPTKASSVAPPFRSRISWAMRVSARSSAASSSTCAFSRNGRAGLLTLLSLRASRGPLKGQARTNLRHSTCAFPPLSTAGERRDDGHVVGWLLALALLTVDLDRGAGARHGRRHEDVIDPEPPAPVERPGPVVPPREQLARLAVQAERVAEPPGSGSLHMISPRHCSGSHTSRSSGATLRSPQTTTSRPASAPASRKARRRRDPARLLADFPHPAPPP